MLELSNGARVTETNTEPGVATADHLLDRARRLFEFLRQAQQLKSPQVASVEAYRRTGEVIWFGHLPLHPAVRGAFSSVEATDEDPLLLPVDRVGRREPPTAQPVLEAWLIGKR